MFDDAKHRRGRATVHAAYGEPIAALAGTALVCRAFEVLASTHLVEPRMLTRLVELLAAATGGDTGIIAGQAMEQPSSGEPSAGCDASFVARYHGLKTGALFAVAAAMGALIAGATDEEVHAWESIGGALGACFQLADDLADVLSSDVAEGKGIAVDAAHARPNAVATLGLSASHARLEALLGEVRRWSASCARARAPFAIFLDELEGHVRRFCGPAPDPKGVHPYAIRAARFRREILPLAGAEIDRVAHARHLVEGDAAAVQLFDLNLRDKASLLALGGCYALECAGETRDALLAVLVRWGAVFTLIDTAIDRGGISGRRALERWARWLSAPLDGTRAAGQDAHPLERCLARWGEEIAAMLTTLPARELVTCALRRGLARHQQLIVYQHLQPDERPAYLHAIGVASYEALCVDGSPGPFFAMIEEAFRRGGDLAVEDLHSIEALYAPDFGWLHVFADDLADVAEDEHDKDLNLARRAREARLDPGQLLVDRVRSFLARLGGVPGVERVLFPLQLMLDEYSGQLAVSDGVEAHAFEEASAIVARAWPRGAGAVMVS
jgi:hypothetical protein